MYNLPMLGRRVAALRIGAAVISLLLAFIVFPAISQANGDADRGKQLFEKRCTGCHSLDRNKEGPRLAGVFGRQAGTAPGFDYSAALKSAHFVWDAERLDRWLTDTDSLVEDNKMDFHVPKADERADIIRYLQLLSSPPKSASNSTK
ncbi:MAG TPA: c-type cytochrome [Candidatus Saccharimonadales bacterium]|nr:c-type cytochrome [Candidatus Saccharimonadales bacterium]